MGTDLLKRLPGADQMLDRLREQGAPYGLEFGELTLLANTQKALRVGQYAKEKGMGNAFADAMFTANFTKCLNIGDPAVITKIATSVGLDLNGVQNAMASTAYAQQLADNLAEGQKRNIRSVPTFIINDEVVLVGAQSADAFRKAFDQIKNGPKSTQLTFS